MRWARAITLGVAVTLAAGTTLAADEAAALFAEGVAAMDAGRFAEACPKLARSQEIDPRPGTLFTLAECEWKRGRAATALRLYDEYLAVFAAMAPEQRSKQMGRDGIARSQTVLLARRVPLVTIEIEPDDSRTAVALDGVALSSLKEVRVDPGEHVVTATRGAASARERFSVRSGEHPHVRLKLASTSMDPMRAIPDAPDRTKIYVAGGVGAAGLVAGTVFGALALGAKSTVDERCGLSGDPAACDPEGKSAADRGIALGWVSTVGFAIGLAGVATAIALLVLEPRGSSRAATVAYGSR